jgi:hypothetical protein
MKGICLFKKKDDNCLSSNCHQDHLIFFIYSGGEESGGGGFVVVDDPDRRLALRSYWTRKGWSSTPLKKRRKIYETGNDPEIEYAMSATSIICSTVTWPVLTVFSFTKLGLIGNAIVFIEVVKDKDMYYKGSSVTGLPSAALHE